MPDPNPHPTLSFALDVADKAIKLAAVLLGGIWTYWNYRKSRTYEQKMELVLSSSILVRTGFYIQISATLKNLGATVHRVQQEGTYCELIAVFDDLSEQSLRLLSVFTRDQYVEPGETISDRLLSLIEVDTTRMVWLKVELRVTSGSVEWQQSDLIRFPDPISTPGKGQ